MANGKSEDSLQEVRVRAMRALIYGECTEHNWEACRAEWLKPSNVRWLEQEVDRQSGIFAGQGLGE